MRKWIKDFVSPPKTVDAENTDMVYILHSITVWGIPVLLLIVVIRILSGDTRFDAIHAFIGIVILTFLAGRLALHFGYFRGTSRAILIVAWVGVTYLAWISDGLENNSLIPYMTIILASAILLGEIDTLVLFTFCIAAIWGIAYADSTGLRITENPQESFNLALNLSINYSLSTVAIYYMIRTLRKSLGQGQKELVDRRQIEAVLRESEEKFRKIFHSNPVAICITELENGRLLEANHAYWSLTGMNPDNSLGKTAEELNLWSNLADRAEFVEKLKTKGSFYNPDDSFEDRHRELKQVISFSEIIHIGDEEHILSMFYDMSQQRRTMDALKESEARTRALLETTPDMLLEITRDGTITNMIPPKGMEESMPADQFINRRIHETFSEAVALQAQFALERAIDANQMNVFEFEENMGGEIRALEARVIASAPNMALMILRDITQRRWAETEREQLIKELEEKNAVAETLREGTSIVAATLEIEETVERILEQLKRVVQYDSASVWLYQGGQGFMVGSKDLPKGAEAPGFYILSEKEPDHPFFVNPQTPYIVLHDIQDDYPQFRVETKNYIHGWMAIPMRARGKLIGFMALDSRKPGQYKESDAQFALTFANQVAIALENARLFSDLQTELAVRQNLISELESKNAELERFTYTVSHDLKSPLFTIRGFLGYLEEDAFAGNRDRMRSDMQRITDATNRMQQLLNELLELSRIGRMKNESEMILFVDLVREAVELVHGRIMQRGVAVHIDADMQNVYGDRQRLLEVVQNLVDNAAKFTSDRPEPRIEIGQDGDEDGMPIFHVRDNGIGIPREHHERIFGLFNKLDVKSEGTGIGLALVRRIVEVHGGRIWVQSEAGQGTTFFFTLPSGPEV
ncbi:MAG TPA: ATP-binding protein [Anaerolineales bacterium]|nr:ATP-binding protein [Anaerolineales bacterium]